MAINSTDLGIQSTGQNTAVQTELESNQLPQPSQTDAPTVQNPAAEEYAERGPTMGTQSGGEEIPAPSQPTTYEDALVQAEYEVERTRVELEVMQDYLVELEAYLAEAPLTGDDRENLMEAVARTRVEIRRRERAVMLAEQKISWMVNYGSEHDFDGDGLTNAQELINEDAAIAAGQVDPNDPNYVPSYLKADSDGDGLTDLTETLLQRNRPDLDIDMFNADSNSNGVDDWLEHNADAADMAAHLGIDNWAYGREGYGSGLSSDPFSSDQIFVPPTDEPESTETPEEPAGPIGPKPGDNAQTIDLAPADDADSTASSQSVATMSAQSLTSNETSMGVQGADDTSDADAPVRTKEEIKNDLWYKNYQSFDNVITIEAEWADGDMTSYKDVIINGTLESDEYLVTQEGEDVLIRTPEKIIRIVKGSQRRIFLNSPDGKADTIVFYNVPMQTIMGGTQAENGEHRWAHGIFIEEPTETGGYYSAGEAAVESEPVVEEDPWSWDAQAVEPVQEQSQDLGEWVERRNPGIENVYTLWDVFQNADGIESNVVTKNGDPVLETNPDTGTQYPAETWTMTSSSDPVYINIPPTVEGIPVWEVEVTAAEDNADNMVIALSSRDGTLLKKIYIENGILYGNTTPGDPSMIFKLPSGVNDPKGFYDNGYNYGGVYFHADTLTTNYVHVIGGAGNDKIIGSSFANTTTGETADFIDGGSGDDIIQTNTAAHIKGGKGHDVLQGSSSNDLIEGEEGNDYIDGGQGSDTIRGGSGNDFMVTRGNDNDIDGGVGDDLTNVAEENDANNTVYNTEHALNNLVNSSETLVDLLNMMQLEGEGAEEVEELVEQLKKEGIEAVAEKIYEMFGTVLGLYERSFLEGSHVDPNTIPTPGISTGTDTTSSSDESAS